MLCQALLSFLGNSRPNLEMPEESARIQISSQFRKLVRVMVRWVSSVAVLGCFQRVGRFNHGDGGFGQISRCVPGFPGNGVVPVGGFPRVPVYGKEVSRRLAQEFPVDVTAKARHPRVIRGRETGLAFTPSPAMPLKESLREWPPNRERLTTLCGIRPGNRHEELS